MSDLISRKELLDKFRYGDVDSAHDKAWIAYVRTVIKKQPTAYDVDKVVEQIGNISERARPVGWSAKSEIVPTKYAVEIVKAGGVSNDCRKERKDKDGN